jgi:hypothetical protein
MNSEPDKPVETHYDSPKRFSSELLYLLTGTLNAVCFVTIFLGFLNVDGSFGLAAFLLLEVS